jgi:maltose-binding protein MalE
MASGYNAQEVGLDSEESIAGMTVLEGLITEGYMGNVTQDDAVTQFTSSKAPFFLSGSWQLNNLNESGVPYALTTIPTLDGSTPSPFVGANGFFINSFSENVGLAQTFLLDFVATPEFMAAIYAADPRNPAYIATAQDVLAGDEIALAFAASAATGVPMPNIPEMGSVWGPMSDQINGMRNGKVDATTAMTAAAEQVRAAVGG